MKPPECWDSIGLTRSSGNSWPFLTQSNTHNGMWYTRLTTSTHMLIIGGGRSEMCSARVTAEGLSEAWETQKHYPYTGSWKNQSHTKLHLDQMKKTGASLVKCAFHYLGLFRCWIWFGIHIAWTKVATLNIDCFPNMTNVSNNQMCSSCAWAYKRVSGKCIQHKTKSKHLRLIICRKPKHFHCIILLFLLFSIGKSPSLIEIAPILETTLELCKCVSVLSYKVLMLKKKELQKYCFCFTIFWRWCTIPVRVRGCCFFS